jgi:hypothetical protein
VTKYRVGRVSRETQEMDERIRAVVERNGGPAPVTVRHVDPETLKRNGSRAEDVDAGVIAYRQASANGNGSAPARTPKVKPAPPKPKRSRVRKQDVAAAAARFPSGFTMAELAAQAGCSPAAAKFHAAALAADGVVAKTGELREHGAAVWKLSDGESEPGAEDGAEPPSDANPDSATATAEDTRFPSVPVGSGRHETQNPVTGMSEHSEPAERLISLPESQPAADPLAAALAELARRRQVLEAAEQALAAVARL